MAKSVTRAIIAAPDGATTIVASYNYYKLVTFAHEWCVKQGGRVVSIERRHDVCGLDCQRLHKKPCVDGCGDKPRAVASPVEIPEPA